MMRLQQFVGRFLVWWRDHSIISLMITGGAVASAIPKYIELTTQAFRWLRGRDAERIEQYIPGSKEWSAVRNARYGFSFQYPSAWLRVTSGSTDGHTVTHPARPEIEIRGWGSHAV